MKLNMLLVLYFRKSRKFLESSKFASYWFLLVNYQIWATKLHDSIKKIQHKNCKTTNLIKKINFACWGIFIKELILKSTLIVTAKFISIQTYCSSEIEKNRKIDLVVYHSSKLEYKLSFNWWMEEAEAEGKGIKKNFLISFFFFNFWIF